MGLVLPQTRTPWRGESLVQRGRATHEVWLSARALSDEPEQEWTFPLFVQRVVAATPFGLDEMYEDVSTWDQLVRAMEWRARLRDLDADRTIAAQLGLETFDAVLRSVDGRLHLPQPWERFRGRHNVAVAGWDPGRSEVVFRNSWGPSWGDRGYGYVGQAFFEAHVDCCMVMRSIKAGLSQQMDDALSERTRGAPDRATPDDYASAWGTPNPAFNRLVDVRGQPHILRMRNIYGFVDGLPCDVVELRLRLELAGRLHVTHDRQNGTSTVTELWVPRQRRRQGIGTFLIKSALALAAGNHSTHLVALLHEADASTVGLPRARAFGDAVGFHWRWKRTRRPDIEGRAEMRVPHFPDPIPAAGRQGHSC